jgi:hypothetical protein
MIGDMLGPELLDNFSDPLLDQVDLDPSDTTAIFEP